ncbi:outer membrane lipoprotein-sorting protein [Xylophilus sp. ASV27]|uniref:outer membrane lipoprotein-sorting protein n=1 Tax=Xylophilus sp. ASV27 TaxID=2795129 RepID=UPI0018EBC301|nr:outer membrane lipoprotein-sorting protein [Xylophilus sp. ASV27]
MKLDRRPFLLIACGAALAAGAAQAAEPDAMELLKTADQGRGGGLPGLVWQVRAHNSGTGADEQQDQTLLVKASGESSVAEVLDPPSSRGAKILQVARNMWLTRPGLKKPVAISPRQRLTGQAAIGDIAATNYARDYSATYLRAETVGDEPCHVLDLKSANRQSTYERITYWVSARRGLAVQAEFLSLSGKKLKSATFEYGNTVKLPGRSVAFISRMSIADALTDARTVMDYTNIKVQAVPSSEFDVGNLQ